MKHWQTSAQYALLSSSSSFKYWNTSLPHHKARKTPTPTRPPTPRPIISAASGTSSVALAVRLTFDAGMASELAMIMFAKHTPIAPIAPREQNIRAQNSQSCPPILHESDVAAFAD